MKLIDKDALVAEIERLKSIQLSIFSKGESIGHCYDSLTCISVYNEILSFLDTLEVKEVDLEKEIKEQSDKYYSQCEKKLQEMDDNDKDLSFLSLDNFAKYFFELGMQVSSKEQKGK